MELLKKLCETPGIAGYEERIQKVIKGELEEVTDEVKVDRLGNVIGIKKANRVPEFPNLSIFTSSVTFSNSSLITFWILSS